MKNVLEFKAEGNAVDIKIYGDIGDNYWKDDDDDSVTTLTELEKFLKENKDAATIDIHINSSGGSVFDGIAMYNVLKKHKAYKRVFIDGFACSIASVIAMCGNKIVMPKTSMMMIHNPWTIAMGNANELRKVADDLDKMGDVIKNAYLDKVNIDEKALTDLMNDESFLNAEECLEYGFCTQIEGNSDEAKEAVEEALNDYAQLYANKLSVLESIKNAIKSIDEPIETEVEDSEIEVEETADEQVIETTEVIEDKPIKEAVNEVKTNALKRFFNKED